MFMKKIRLTVLLLISIAIMLMASSCSFYTPYVPPAQYTLVYMAGAGGKIMGEQIQIVDEGDDAETVTAVPKDGYAFVGWSDGVQEAERTDTNVKGDIDVVANFSQVSKSFTLDYKFGTAQNAPSSVKFGIDNFEKIDFPVPEREHFTFGGWYCGETQVTDENGKMTVGEEILDEEDTELSAKWTADETFVYKILLVYVTKVDAILGTRHVNYSMSDLECKFCSLTTKRVERYLDDMLDGIVDFKVDEYYTTETIFTDNIRATQRGDKISYYSYPIDIPEVKDYLNDYDSSLSIISFDIVDENFYSESGFAIQRYGGVRLDSFIYSANLYNYSFEEVVDILQQDGDYKLWNEVYILKDYWFDTFIHELAHTIEQRVNLYDYHSACVSKISSMELDCLEANKQYFLHETIVENKKVGIPYGFWKGDIVPVRYRGSNGELLGNRQIVIGEYFTFTTVAAFGNVKFAGWSDGVTSRTRTDLITEETTFVAIYE